MRGKTVVQHVAIAGLVWAAVAAPAAAQAKLELAPLFVSYYALSDLHDDVNLDGTNITERQTNSPGFGGRLTYWVSQTLGIQAEGIYTASGTAYYDKQGSGGASQGGIPGTLTTVSGRLLFRPARTNLYLLGGVAGILRGGDTWNFDFITQKTAVGGVLGVGARASVTPKLGLDVSAQVLLYSSDPDGSAQPTYYESKMQTDLMIVIGVPIALMK